MPRFTVFADVDRVVTAGGSPDVPLSAGEAVEIEVSKGSITKPGVLKPTKLDPTLRVDMDALGAEGLREADLEQLHDDDPVVAEIATGGDVALENLEPLREQAHASGHDLIVVLTERGG
jgi:hypothetical protein